MSGFIPTADDFRACVAATADELTAHAPSQWRQVWIRLRKNRNAVVALRVIAALVSFTLLGPLLWRVDPARQNPEQASLPPNLGYSARVVNDAPPWEGAPTAPVSPVTEALVSVAPQRIRTAAPPTTQGVRIVWTPVPGASAYAIYRHEWSPHGIHDLGLPLGEVAADTMGYEDRLALEPRIYYYSVAPLGMTGERDAFATVAVTPQRAIALDEAQSGGLLSAGAGTEYIGRLVRLPARPLGTDWLGRDLLARAMQGARISLLIGIAAPLLFVTIGTLYGGIAGYAGGRIDNAMMRGADFVIALPLLLFMILFKVGFGIRPGESGITPILLALIVLGWPAPARLVRGEMLRLRERAHVQAARLMGGSAVYLIRVHLLPNTLGVVLVALSFSIPGAIFTEAFLSFLGLGVAPPQASWGSMCNDGLRGMLEHPHELAVPATLISITVLAFNLLGDGLRDALDVGKRGLP